MATNERTFQGELYRIINSLLENHPALHFSKITQEENVGVPKKNLFSDGKLYSKSDNQCRVYFELKNDKWDALNEIVVNDAAQKAYLNGIEYFVTGTPHMLVLFETFRHGVPLAERKLKVYPLTYSFADNVLSSQYENTVKPLILDFLKDLGSIVHKISEVSWDSIDAVFINKLSFFIHLASMAMHEVMFPRLTNDKVLRDRVVDYLKSQDVFNISLSFDSEDVFRLCQLANYLLFLKIIFYSYLERDFSGLKLLPLEIPDDNGKLKMVLRERFDHVLTYDFELIFCENVFDDFQYSDQYLSILRDNVQEIKNLDFQQFNFEVIGSIYNTLIDNQEQHDRGQHFTNSDEVDIINSFCINENTKNIIDSGCGAGTFLVRGYYFLKFFHPHLDHQQLLMRLWGVEISPFPALLATMNLSLLDLKSDRNYPIIINDDFSQLSVASPIGSMLIHKVKIPEITTLSNDNTTVALPVFDSCVGNPPFIRQEKITDKHRWLDLIFKDFNIDKINGKSDLYVYYLIHTASFLADGGRLGYVLSSSWLDSNFGTDLQKFLLDNFRIIAIIENQSVRSFTTASVNTIILILERCTDSSFCDKNKVKFVRVFSNYRDIIGTVTSKDRIANVSAFSRLIETTNDDCSGATFSIKVINQSELERRSTYDGHYLNGYWGSFFLRSSKIFDRLSNFFNSAFFPVSKYVSVQYGIKSGANEFFYLTDDTEMALSMPEEDYLLMFGESKANHISIWKNCGWFFSKLTSQHHVIERSFIKPLIKSQSKVSGLVVDPDEVKECVFSCSYSKDFLRVNSFHALDYILIGESSPHDLHFRPSIKARDPWYDLSSISVVGDFIFPAKIGEYYRVIDNRISGYFCDKVSYTITVKDEYKSLSDELFLLLNSMTFRYFVELFSRQLTGNQTISDVDVNIVEKSYILDPNIFKNHMIKSSQIVKSLKSRRQETIFGEVNKQDKVSIDSAIFRAVNMTEEDRMAIYSAACELVSKRSTKSKSIVKVKPKKKFSTDEILLLSIEEFSAVSSYKHLIGSIPTMSFDFSYQNIVFPNINLDTPEVFKSLSVAAQKNSTKDLITFDNETQLLLYEFLYRKVQTRSQDILLPVDETQCLRVLKSLESDYRTYFLQITEFLKKYSSKVQAVSVYKSLLFRDLV